RRGRATVHKKWDVNTAILAGDAILVKAYQALGGVSAVLLPQVLQMFSQAILEVCEGQALDMEFEHRSDVTVQDYFSMIERKTGRLFSAACALGALLGGGSREQVRSMSEFGAAVGRAFQIQDDMLDFTADQSVLGKDIGSDLRRDKNSFLLLYARENGNEAQIARLRALQNKPHLTAADIQEAVCVLRETGAVDAALREVNSALDHARISLQCLNEEKPKLALEQLVEFIRMRES
ncbi:MAG: polyprenyl synthetase family protein, partial [candidate division KSB1 bacterium]|nr:polyprenyl synthetase family protein [candidate division KSB1 bacterium]